MTAAYDIICYVMVVGKYYPSSNCKTTFSVITTGNIICPFIAVGNIIYPEAVARKS